MARMSVRGRRDLLIEAAERVITDEGIAAATTRAISAEAAMPQSMFHYCFESRTVLLREVIVRLKLDAGMRTLSEIPLGDSLRETLENTFRVYITEVQEHAFEQLMVYETAFTALREPDLSPLAEDVSAHMLSAIYDFVRTITERFTVVWAAPVPVIVTAYAMMGNGATVMTLLDANTAVSDAVISNLADMFLANVVSCSLLDGGPDIVAGDPALASQA